MLSKAKSAFSSLLKDKVMSEIGFRAFKTTWKFWEAVARSDSLIEFIIEREICIQVPWDSTHTLAQHAHVVTISEAFM
jgi:hypothetical protein